MMRVPFDLYRQTFIENWPEPFRKLGIPSWVVPLTLSEARCLGSSMSIYGSRFGPAEYSDQLDSVRINLRRLLAILDNHAFVRLGSRSPKDSIEALRNGLLVRTADQALRLLKDGSKRVADDLEVMLMNNYSPVIHLRPWYNIIYELRLFFTGGRCVGVWQQAGPPLYRVYHEAQGIADECNTDLCRFFDEIAQKLHMRRAIVDIGSTGTAAERAFFIIDLNPFHPLADFGPFSDGRFDGSIRSSRDCA